MLYRLNESQKIKVYNEVLKGGGGGGGGGPRTFYTSFLLDTYK